MSVKYGRSSPAPPTPIEQSQSPCLPKETLPTMYDLPSESPEEPGLPDEYHLWQAELCSITFCPPTHSLDQVLVASDLNLYYDPDHTGWYKRPDWYAVVGVPRLYEGREPRLSYVFWHEGVRPVVALEFLSPGTRDEDLGETERGSEPPTKWEVYEQILGIPYYIVFDRYTDELRVFLLEGDRYQEQELEEGRIWLPILEIGIGLWLGEYRGLTRQWLRWYDSAGNWIPTPAEEALAAQQRAEAAQQRAEAAQQQAEAAQQQAEAAQQQTQEERARAEAAQQQTQEERARAEAAQQRAEAAERTIALGISRLLNLGFSVEQIAETLSLSVEEVNSRLSE